MLNAMLLRRGTPLLSKLRGKACSTTPVHLGRFTRRAASTAVAPATTTTPEYSDLVWTAPADEAVSPIMPPAPEPAPPTVKPTVADLDAQLFNLHPSVARWQSFEATFSSPFTGQYSNTNTMSLTDALSGIVRRFTATASLQDSTSAAFWAYHSARITFFIGQAVAGLLAHHAYETVSRGFSSSVETPLTRFSGGNLGADLSARVYEALGTFEQDLANIRAGAYPMPWDMTSLTHRQFSPLWQLGRTVAFLDNSVATLNRRIREEPDQVWLSSSMYPQYYLNTFHYQTDGWFSDKSARVYEHSTEVLFFGRQDAMQRTSLLPIQSYMDASGRDPASMRLLEVAAGTGRFHTYIKDAYPTMPSVCSDLSPFYLARARENVSYWKSQRQAATTLGGIDNTGVTYLQTAAEKIDAPDASFDIVMCVYLFHELPETIRKRAVAEFFRVLKPGGLCVFTDSVQSGDRPAWDGALGNFGNFNEPYYVNYVGCDLGSMFKAAGFEPQTKYLSSATKTLSFRKPEAETAAPVAAAAASASDV